MSIASPLLAADLRLEPMTVEDLDWVVEAEGTIHRFPWSRGDFADSLAAGHRCLLLRYRDVRAGYAVCMFGVDDVSLLNISVLPALQGRGLGSALMQQVCDEARAAGKAQLFLEVRASNDAAQGLYAKWGFVLNRRRRAYYQADEGREDALELRKDL